MILPEQETLLRAYLQGVEQINQNINLTAIDLGKSGYALHIEDSLLALEEVNLAPEGPLVDLGTGAGFPGVPLAVATARPTTLVDSVKKKINAIEGLISSLGIKGVEGFAGRAEELAVQRPEEYSVVTARAMAPLPALLELAAPLLAKGGRLIAYKTPLIESSGELEAAYSVQKLVGMEFVSYRQTRLEWQEAERTIVVFAKMGAPEITLPRRIGMAQKRPLK